LPGGFFFLSSRVHRGRIPVRCVLCYVEL
jgi:hypothetical protein